MPLDPQAQLFLDQMAALGAPAMSTLTPEQVRENIKWLFPEQRGHALVL